MASQGQNSEDSDYDDPFENLPFENVTSETLHISHVDSEFELDNHARRRTYARADFEENQRRRFSFDVEMYIYLQFHVRAFLLSIIQLCQTRLMFWLAAG